MLLPDCIDDLIGPDNPVRVIDAFIDSLDMKKLGFERPIPNTTGRPCYDPRDLLKLYVYGYFSKIRSSRKLMAECSRNIELFFLLNRLTPDFRTIHEARVMQSKDGFHCCYNVQAAVDKGSHLIADFKVTNCCTDQGLLKEASDGTREILETETLEVVADKGYESREDIQNCIMNGIIPNVAFKYDKKERLYTIDYVEAEISEEEKNSTRPENIQKCIRAGVLPSCYENTAIEVELQEQTTISCFILNEDGTVTCPMGNILSKTKMRGKSTIYANRDACRQCPNKCTSSKQYKTVSFGPDTKYVPVRMYGSANCTLNQIPKDIPPNAFNHILDRKDFAPKKVVLHVKCDDEKLKERMCLSEHPFGTVKWYHGAHYLLCKGKEKAAAELGLSFLTYNLKRVINLLGVQGLLAAF